MIYSFENVTLENGSKILKPLLPKEFEDFAVMLLIDVHWDDERYTSVIESVIQGQLDEDSIAGNTGILTVHKDFSSFTNFFEENPSTCTIKTDELYQLILDWKNALFISIKNGKIG